MTSSKRNSAESEKNGPEASSPTEPQGQSGPTDGKERRTAADRRNSVIDRRTGLDRREDKADLPDLRCRRGPGIRRPEDRRAAEEGEMTDEQWKFLKAIEEYKRVNNVPFPTWTEVLEVIKKLGYSRVDPL